MIYRSIEERRKWPPFPSPGPALVLGRPRRMTSLPWDPVPQKKIVFAEVRRMGEHSVGKLGVDCSQQNEVLEAP